MKDEGYKVLDALLPQTHDSKIYGGEPYVLAADVYASPAQDGKAGWTWYTGAAGWYFRVVLEELLGIKIRDGKTLEINPKLPTNIDAFTATLRIDEGEYGIVCKNKDGKAEYPLSRGRHIIEI